MEWREVSCKCGFTYENNKEEFEIYPMKIGSFMGQELPKKLVPRCKTCKTISFVERPYLSCEIYKDDAL